MLFTPKRKIFYFNFNAHSCEEKRTGVCSLFCGGIEKIDYCQSKARKALIQKTIIEDDVYITQFKCGHYASDNGQHRICVYGKLGLSFYILKEHFQCCHTATCPACRTGSKNLLIKF